MKTALILSGGGARAAYQVGVLKAVAEILPREARNPFPIICGTSAGAINGVTIAAHEGSFQEAVGDLCAIWEALEPGDIYRYGWLELARGVVRFARSLLNQGIGVGKPIALLDNAPLRELISSAIHFEKIDRAIARGDLEAVGVTAMDYQSGESVCFFQANSDLQDWQRFRRIGRRTLLNADHLMASSAIPTLFPSTRIEFEYFGDGALRQVSPISPALHMGADRVFIVGVSNNRDPAPRHDDPSGNHSPSMAQIIGHMFNSAFVDSLEGDIERLDRINKLVALIPEEVRSANSIQQRSIDRLVISPSEELDQLAGDKVHHIHRSLRVFLNATGATVRGGGSAAASYLLFAKPFIDELITLGYNDTMRERKAIAAFLGTERTEASDGP